MVEMEDFKYGGTNITAFRLVDPGSELVQQVSRKSSRGYLMKIDFVIELYFPKNDSVLFT